ncbi:glycosyltransferase involved in cell wall biosynthesis [Kibdelosporangium banguiense]|uniref:Glycosyltransferase involved in cell wall biosynthesis n=1 Tax=Kibdelosporangium banguiense TaxID=1365924 RepID=A0ABS4U1Y4_9PSEU|nr:glycosyltransferase family A protein [Kibdelosporangium banguiense]MBP2330673.1 glycosyltransferase involved in cell wall biosynthesis [Kibdelosporangium banguiense]
MPHECQGIDVLIPTRDRPAELATTLAGLAAQDFPSFRVILSDQSDQPLGPAVCTMIRVLRQRGVPVMTQRNMPRRGLAHQRHFLLRQAQAPHVLFLDDDIWLQPGALRTLHEAILELRCGLVGFAPQGLSYSDDIRPAELEPYEEWTGPPEPERIAPGSPQWRRWTLHNAANLVHLARRLRLQPGERRSYKIAWVGACVLFDRSALEATGGFRFWTELPVDHCGEDVVAQHRVMRQYGGAGILPSAAVHLESPTTVPNRQVQAHNVIVADKRLPAE